MALNVQAKRMRRDAKDVTRLLAMYYYCMPSGPGVKFMGGMEQHKLMVMFGADISGRDFTHKIAHATREQLDKALVEFKETLAYVDAHPTKTCPCCGATVKARRKL